jgi:drug/metabolite transporter (DMT)-like permease
MVSSASSLELMFRNLLEKYLVARPRTKELIAFPILLLIPCLAKFKSREWSFIAMGAGMIGIENVINSFCHIRMPVFVTTLSTIFSLIFAIIIGSICVVIVDKIKEKF